MLWWIDGVIKLDQGEWRDLAYVQLLVDCVRGITGRYGEHAHMRVRICIGNGPSTVL